MPRISRIKYNPSLSVAENAKINGVSEPAIRYYIKTRKLDRRYDKKQIIIATCKQYLLKHPNASRNKLHRKTGYSLTTIRHYWENISEEIPLTVLDKKKRQSKHITLQIKKIENIQNLKSLIDELNAVEKENSKALQAYPSPSLETLTRWEEYDASKYMCFAFRKKGDLRKGKYLLDFGNMCGGYEFDMEGIHFKNSEAAYICGMFSNGSEEHIRIQEALIADESGYDAKKNIRHFNEDKGRKDWYEFNQQWMLYVVWKKIQDNEQFRNLLMAIPDGAIIIEDSSFQNGSTATFWGTKNNERKDFYKIVKKYIDGTEIDASEKKKDEMLLKEFNDFTDYGTYRGCNVMGKILMICRQCVKDGTEPDIDYVLLRSKHIHLLGKELTF